MAGHSNGISKELIEVAKPVREHVTIWSERYGGYILNIVISVHGLL